MADVQAAVGRLLVGFRDTVCLKYAAEAEQRAKANAPWTDRTSDARKLLKGVVLDNDEVTLDTYKQVDGKTVCAGTMTVDGKGCIGVALCHRVEYGKHLETAHDCKYAILKPTIEGLREEFFSTARKFFGGK